MRWAMPTRTFENWQDPGQPPTLCAGKAYQVTKTTDGDVFVICEDGVERRARLGAVRVLSPLELIALQPELREIAQRNRWGELM